MGVSMSSSKAKADQSPNLDFNPAEAAGSIWAEAQQALAESKPERFSDETVQQLMTAAMKLFAAKVEKEDRFFSPILGEVVTPTEVVVSVSEILKAVNLNTFDLAMWFQRTRPD